MIQNYVCGNVLKDIYYLVYFFLFNFLNSFLEDTTFSSFSPPVPLFNSSHVPPTPEIHGLLFSYVCINIKLLYAYIYVYIYFIVIYS